uniref:Sperm associated antigen 4 n=1 Tax=Sarcophilus harrisii TaxID=9305 RepID=A0A7N4NVD1_SARHA
MRRSPRPGSAAPSHKHNPDFYSDRSNSSVSATSRDRARRSRGPWEEGPPPGGGNQGSPGRQAHPYIYIYIPEGLGACPLPHAPTLCSCLLFPALCSPTPLCSEYHERVHSQGLQLQQLQAELDKLHTDVSSIRAANSERVAQLVFQRLNEDFVQKPDYALSSVGASIDLDKTSHDYEDRDTAYFWNRFSFWNYAKPPTVILEPDVFPGNCWAFQGAKGQVVIRLPGRVQLSDITLQHPPPSVAHIGGASSAPKDFAVYGLQGDDKTEILLGKFTFDVEKSEIQTFHLKNEPPLAFPKVKIQILSNWGHPRFTCLYRVRAHGLRSHDMQREDSRTKGEPVTIPH